MSIEYNTGQESHKGYYLSAVKIKDHNVMIDERNSFDQPIKNYLRTYENFQKTTHGQRYDYTTGCLLVYPYFKEY